MAKMIPIQALIKTTMSTYKIYSKMIQTIHRNLSAKFNQKTALHKVKVRIKKIYQTQSVLLMIPKKFLILINQKI